MKKRVFSGMRPTGRMHVGNYLGAVSNWVEMQNDHQCVYSVVDYHAITTPYETERLASDTRDMLFDLLAAGIDPELCVLTVQSQIPQHAELAWILGTITPLGWLERVPTFKEKSDMHPDYVNLGLLSYPVLMAADILLYRAEGVPVGADQEPHIELTREIVRRFNYMFGETFEEPQVILREDAARVRSLTDPSKKMSKSLGPASYIGIGDPPEAIREKVMKAVTDIGPLGKEMSPGVANLFLLLKSFGCSEECEAFEDQYRQGTLRYVNLKEATAEAIIRGLEPIRERRLHLMENPSAVENSLARMQEEAETLAEETMRQVRRNIGLHAG